MLSFITQLQISHNNVTYVDKVTGQSTHQLPDNFGLYKSLQLAGSSFGVVTEFLYRIYPVPEVTSTIALVYIENKVDLWRFEKAGLGQ